MRNADAGGGEVIDDEPRVGEPGDFGAEKTTNERDEGNLMIVTLDEDVSGGGVTDDKFGDDQNDRVGDGSKNRCGGGADKHGDEGLNDGEGLG